MNPYHFSSQPPPQIFTTVYGHQSYLGSPQHLINPYQPSNLTPYPTPTDYMTPHPSQTYLQPHPPTIHTMQPPPPPFVTGGYPYNHPIYDEEPSCFISFLENFCCCFGFGVPQNHHEAMHKHEIQRRRLIAKEERNRIKQYQKVQEEKQRLTQIQQQKQSYANTTTAAANNNTATTATTATTGTTANNQ